jgi:hypothetical protein
MVPSKYRRTAYGSEVLLSAENQRLYAVGAVRHERKNSVRPLFHLTQSCSGSATPCSCPLKFDAPALRSNSAPVRIVQTSPNRLAAKSRLSELADMKLERSRNKRHSFQFFMGRNAPLRARANPA